MVWGVSPFSMFSPTVGRLAHLWLSPHFQHPYHKCRRHPYRAIFPSTILTWGPPQFVCWPLPLVYHWPGCMSFSILHLGLMILPRGFLHIICPLHYGVALLPHPTAGCSLGEPGGGGGWGGKKGKVLLVDAAEDVNCCWVGVVGGTGSPGAWCAQNGCRCCNRRRFCHICGRKNCGI